MIAVAHSEHFPHQADVGVRGVGAARAADLHQVMIFR